MRKTGLFLASIALSATLWAESPEKKGLDVINKANAEAYIGFLASDALEGREAGFRGGRIAGEYIVSHLKTMGSLCSNLIINLSRPIIRNGKREAASRFIRIRSRS